MNMMVNQMTLMKILLRKVRYLLLIGILIQPSLLLAWMSPAGLFTLLVAVSSSVQNGGSAPTPDTNDLSVSSTSGEKALSEYYVSGSQQEAKRLQTLRERDSSCKRWFQFSETDVVNPSGRGPCNLGAYLIQKSKVSQMKKNRVSEERVSKLLHDYGRRPVSVRKRRLEKELAPLGYTSYFMDIANDPKVWELAHPDYDKLGRQFQYDQVALAPRPLIKRIYHWIASDDETLRMKKKDVVNVYQKGNELIFAKVKAAVKVTSD